MIPRVTALLAAPLAFLLAGMGLFISRHRRRHGVGPGMTGTPAFTRLQRAHGNAAEHVPLVLVLSLLGELTGTPRPWVLGLGAAFLLARLMHAAGLLQRSKHPLHFLGAALTYFVEIAWGLALLWRGLSGV